MADAKRLLRLVRLDADNVPLVGCTGSCNQGRARCDCATGCTEIACDIAPDADRCIQAPVRTREDDAYRARVLRWSVVAALAAWGALAALLELFGASRFRL